MIRQLIDEANNILGTLQLNSYEKNYTGKVSCALITKEKHIYTGVSIDLVCGLGNCAEYSAICEMVKNHETEIDMIVAIYEGGKIIPPCGRCRELLVQIDINNINTKVIIDEDNYVLLKDLLPKRWS